MNIDSLLKQYQALHLLLFVCIFISTRFSRYTQSVDIPHSWSLSPDFCVLAGCYYLSFQNSRLILNHVANLPEIAMLKNPRRFTIAVFACCKT